MLVNETRNETQLLALEFLPDVLVAFVLNLEIWKEYRPAIEEKYLQHIKIVIFMINLCA